MRASLILFGILSFAFAFESAAGCFEDAFRAELLLDENKANDEVTAREFISFVDQRPLVLSEDRRLESLGFMNAGLYEYVDSSGARHFVKALKIKVSGTEHLTELANELKGYPAGTHPSKETLIRARRFNAKVLSEIRNAHLIESVGGPKLHGFGVLKLGKTEFPYLDMEPVFKEPFFTMKTGMQDFREMLATSKGPAVAKQMAQAYLSALEHGIVPWDPDFAISYGGKVRWIDAGLWRTRVDSSKSFSSHWTTSLVEVIQGFADAERPAPLRQFLETILRGVKHSFSISADEKNEILSNLVIFDQYKHANYDPMFGYSGFLRTLGIANVQEFRNYYDSL